MKSPNFIGKIQHYEQDLKIQPYELQDDKRWGDGYLIAPHRTKRPPENPSAPCRFCQPALESNQTLPMSLIAFDGETYVVTENGRPIVKDQIMVLPINHRTDPISSDFRLIRYLAQNGFKNLNCLPVGQQPELVKTTDQGDLLAHYSDPFALYLNATAGSGRSIAHVHPNGFPADYVPLPSAEKAPWEVCQDAQTGAVISRFEMGFYALVLEGADPEGIAKTLERFHQAMIEWKIPYNFIAFPVKKQGSESPVVRMVVVPREDEWSPIATQRIAGQEFLTGYLIPTSEERQHAMTRSDRDLAFDQVTLPKNRQLEFERLLRSEFGPPPLGLAVVGVHA